MNLQYIRRLSPQCDLILNHLEKGHSITQRSALMDFGVMALPRRIKDLKEMGYPIRSVMETNNLTGQRYARYSLEKETLQ
ncbi:helix-turn-helix domain-containing protein [Geopseudomonas guangdongensis]|uniref:Helix-turn-helix domain-containing protein n=1 Tax=Geopseudomonas guangdongensis TaxID=1245526 RepID=A0A1H2I729_9GAMM|nr:helix-turn-helix domain-containing protein [Pseudomonas guangdongensis]SDU39746.1 Helix-turn-helix domain-containing protein [Pseudomonas guangdongensis]